MNNFDLNELNLDNICQWPKPVKTLIVIILSIIIITLSYLLILKDNFKKYDNLKAKENNLLQQFELKHKQLANLDSYRNQIKIMKERLSQTLSQLPTENEMPGLLEEISKTGITAGLKFVQFLPLAEIKHGFYSELPIKMTVISNYHQLAIFISRVASMSRIITLHDFKIVNTDLIESKTKGYQQRMELTAKIYRSSQND